MTEYTSDKFKKLLEKLVKTPDDFTPDDLKLALEHLVTPDVVPPTQIGAFLAATHIHRVEHRAENLTAAAEVLRSRALKAVVEDEDKDFVVDIVGTGGDGHNTFNVSTAAGIVAAGAGARVVKHGSRASTSSSGSADFLQSLDCHFVPPADTHTHIPRVPFTFLLAPHYHPSLALLAPHRKLLPFRTLFNVVGPLINPARPRGMLLGVATRELGRPFAQSLRDAGVVRALVVCGVEGLDEISCAGDTWAWALAPDGTITETVLHPAQFGLGTHELTAVSSGRAAENAAVLRRMLTGGSAVAGDEAVRPVLEFVLMNAAALLVVAGVAGDYRDGVRLARESLESGGAWKALESFREAGRTAMAGAAGQGK